jgi:AcrR family transcriptional regulator
MMSVASGMSFSSSKPPRLLADGYTATTLAAVAEAAQVGARTVYVRFGTKAALLKRVVDVAVVGDAEPVDVGRDPARSAMTALTSVADCRRTSRFPFLAQPVALSQRTGAPSAARRNGSSS